MGRTVVDAVLSCGKTATIRKCTLQDLKHLAALEDKMGVMKVEDILLGEAPEFSTLFSSCVQLPAGVDKLELDSDDVCEIADKFREVNSRFLARYKTLNVILTLGTVFEEGQDPQAAAVDLLLGTLKDQLQVAVP